MITLEARKEDFGFTLTIRDVKRLLREAIPVRVMPTKTGQTLINKGVTRVYIRGVSKNGGGFFIFFANQHPVDNLTDTFSLTEEDLALEEACDSTAKKSGG